MNDSQNIIVSLIEKLGLKFRSMTFTYAFNYGTQQHIIVVNPEEMYDNEGYAEAECDFINEFIGHNLSEGVLFVSESSHIKVSNPIFEFSNCKRKFFYSSGKQDGSQCEVLYELEIGIPVEEVLKNVDFIAQLKKPSLLAEMSVVFSPESEFLETYSLAA